MSGTCEKDEVRMLSDAVLVEMEMRREMKRCWERIMKWETIDKR